jgi:hypothetical protein
VNRLVAALLQRPDVIDPARPAGVVQLHELLRLLGSDAIFGSPDWLDRALEREASGGGPPRRAELILASYIAVETASAWNAAVGEAASPARVPSDDMWRTVLIPGTTGSHGFTAPQRYTSDEYVALFAGREDGARILLLSPERHTARSIAKGDGHCSPPVRGICAPGTCGGCRTVAVWDPSTNGQGLACQCPDQQ